MALRTWRGYPGQAAHPQPMETRNGRRLNAARWAIRGQAAEVVLLRMRVVRVPHVA
ncbi:hypothetical protein ACFPRL_10935 [Pseudoclavibacter helvolus]